MYTTAPLLKQTPKSTTVTTGKATTNPLQRKVAGEDDDAVQRKQSLVQLQDGLEDEEESLQMKAAPVQLEDGLDDDEEEEPLQMKINPAQLQADLDEEDALQMKQTPVQRKEIKDDEEPLQMKRNPLQRKPYTNNPLQRRESETTTPQLKKENNTGLPDNLKAGVEALSGYSMDDVKVHYNSDKPAQLQALAYAQGTDIHVAPGQEQHLPHEAWHVVQQKQGRVQPTVQMKQGVAVNDDKGLENEADVMGEKMLSSNTLAVVSQKAKETQAVSFLHNQPIQAARRKRYMQTVDGRLLTEWQELALDFKKMKPSDARKILRNVEMKEMEASEEEIEKLQTILSTASSENPLTRSDAEWSKKEGLIHRFHSDPEALKKEYDSKELSGHQVALYDLQWDASEESGEKNDVLQDNLLDLIFKTANASLSHVKDKGDRDTASIMSTSKPQEEEQSKKLVSFNKDAPSWLADTSKQSIEGETAQYIPHTINKENFENYHDSFTGVADRMIAFIKSRGSSYKPSGSIEDHRIPLWDNDLLPKEKSVSASRQNEEFSDNSSAKEESVLITRIMRN